MAVPREGGGENVAVEPGGGGLPVSGQGAHGVIPAQDRVMQRLN